MSLVENTEHLKIAKGFGVKEFGELLESVMGREDRDTQKKSFSPSSLGYDGSCPRRWYYAFNGAYFEYDINPQMQAQMDAGTQAGERIADLMDKAGILEKAEEEVTYDDPPIRGFIDAIVNWKGEIIPAEVKTTKTETWTRRLTTNSVPGYQLLQLLIYMYIKDVDRGFFITENKNDHRLFILPVRMNDEYKALVEYVFDWMRKVKDNADNGELPTRPFTRSSIQCKGCPVRNTCYPEDYRRGSVNGHDPNPGTIDIEPLQLPK